MRCLLDRTIQWMFHKSRIIEFRNQEAEGREKGSGSYVELVVSCSRSLVEKSKGEIVELAVRELKEFFPGARAGHAGEIDGHQGSACDVFAGAGD